MEGHEHPYLMVITDGGARHLGGMESVSIEEPFGAD